MRYFYFLKLKKTMKNLILTIIYLQSTMLLAQKDTITAKVYSLKDSITRESKGQAVYVAFQFK